MAVCTICLHFYNVTLIFSSRGVRFRFCWTEHVLSRITCGLGLPLYSEPGAAGGRPELNQTDKNLHPHRFNLSCNTWERSGGRRANRPSVLTTKRTGITISLQNKSNISKIFDKVLCMRFHCVRAPGISLFILMSFHLAGRKMTLNTFALTKLNKRQSQRLRVHQAVKAVRFFSCMTSRKVWVSPPLSTHTAPQCSLKDNWSRDSI